METDLNNKLDSVLKKEFQSMEIEGPTNGLDAFMAKIPNQGLSFLSQIFLLSASLLAVAVSAIIVSDTIVGHARNMEVHEIAKPHIDSINSYTFIQSESSELHAVVQPIHHIQPVVNTKTSSGSLPAELQQKKSVQPDNNEIHTASIRYEMPVEPEYQIVYDTLIVADTIIVYDTVVTNEFRKLSLRKKRKHTR